MTILAADNYLNNGRVLTNGWNTSYDTQAWQVAAGGAANFSVVSGKGQITGATSIQEIFLGSGVSVDADIRARVTVSNTADSIQECARMTAFNTGYRLRLQNNTLSVVVVIAGTVTVLNSTAFTTTTGASYQMHLRLRGSTISGSVWLDGTSEPTSFMVSGTDTQVTAAGQYGIACNLSVSTDVVTVDQFVATNPTQVADSPYGVTIGLTNKTPPTANYANWHSLFADMRVLNLSWLRFQIDWQLIQLNQTDPVSAFAWAPLDEAVSRVNEAGLYITHALRGAPTWALDPAQGAVKTSTLPSYAMNVSMATTFAGQVATRYNNLNGHGLLNAYELGNEQFNQTFVPSGQGYLGLYNSPYAEYNGLGGVNINVQPARDPHYFVPFVSQVSPAISAASATTKVILAAIWWRQFPNVRDFLADIYAEIGASAKNLFSASNFHYYSNTANPSVDGTGANYSPSYQQAWQAMQLAMYAAGDVSKAIWNTEVGWSTNTNGGNTIDCDTNTQSTRFSYVYSTARLSGFITKIFFFTLNYKVPDTQSASIVQWDVASQSYIKLPAYTTIQNFISAYPQWSNADNITTLPAISRRDGTSPALTIKRRDGIVPLVKRRDGIVPLVKRRDGTLVAIKRRDGAVIATKRRG